MKIGTRYYRAGRTDRDHNYFRLGKSIHDGLKVVYLKLTLAFQPISITKLPIL